MPGRKRADHTGTAYWDAARRRWRGQIMVGTKPDGKPDIRHVSAGSPEEAYALLADIHAHYEEARAGSHYTPSYGYWVYVLKVVGGPPFYVGSGRITRPQEHLASALRNYPGATNEYIRAALLAGKRLEAVVVLKTADLATARDVEDRLIRAIGLEHLTNHRYNSQAWADEARAAAEAATWESKRRAMDVLAAVIDSAGGGAR